MANYKLVDADQLDNDLKLIANSIRQKTQTTEELSFPEDFSNAITEIGGAEAEQLDVLINGSITEISSNVTSVRPYAFYSYKELISINLPNVTNIGGSAFYGCENLIDVNAPMLIDIDGTYAFNGCKSISSINFPLLRVSSTDNYMFSGCKNLSNVNLPSATQISQNMFYGCEKLSILDFPSVVQINAQAFQSASALTTLILRNESEVCRLTNTTAFGRTPFASGGIGGTLLVPSALLETYKTATNWSALYAYGTNHFLALEDYTVDGTLTGEINWDKLNSYLESLSIE